MDKIVEMLIEKCFEPAWGLSKRLLLGYDKSEVISMKKAITKASLREDEYLEKRQYSFMFKSLILCIGISYIMMFYMPNLISDLVTLIINEFIVETKQTIEMHLKVDCIWLLFSNITLYTILFVYMNETFKNHTYGYNSLQKSFSKLCKYNKKSNIVNILFFIVTSYFIITHKIQITYIIYGILTLTILLDYVYYTLKRKEDIFSVYVREQGSELVTDVSDDIDGENDINIICIDDTPIKVNIFKENIHIVENNNILILGKNINKTLDKNKIRQIDVDNKMGIHIIIQYDSSANKWVKR